MLLTYEHVQHDHLQNLMDNMWHWLATTRFPTNKDETEFLGNRTKVKHFKNIKAIFKLRFPSHKVWEDKEYYAEARKCFLTSCGRKRIKDPSVIEVRKSEPLYRKLKTSRTCIREKWNSGPYAHIVDCVMICSEAAKDGGAKACEFLGEFNVMRQVIG